LIAGGSLWAQPKFEVVGGDTYNWGKVSSVKSPLKATVKLRNTGNEPLWVKVKAGCGCTTPKLEKDTLAPGEETNLHIGLNVGNKVGPLTKSMTFTTNDPEKKRSYMYLKADLYKAISYSPTFMAFDALKVGEKATAVVKLSNNSTKPVVIKDVTTTNDLKLSLANETVLAAGQSVDVKGTVVPKKTGTYQSQITIKTTHPDHAVINITAAGNVTEAPKSPAFNTSDK
jgi:hypothetical protein